MSKLHIVGHSVGAHLGGLIGRLVIEKSNGVFKLRRISALDPAFAPYFPATQYKPLNKNDAEMVKNIMKIFYGFLIRFVRYLGGYHSY